MTKISIQVDKKPKELVNEDKKLINKDKKLIASDKKKLAADKRKLATDKKKIAAEAREAKKKAAAEAREAKKKARGQAVQVRKKAVQSVGMGGTYGGVGGILGGGGGAVIINNPPLLAAKRSRAPRKRVGAATMASSLAPNVNVVNNMPPTMTSSMAPPMTSVPERSSNPTPPMTSAPMAETFTSTPASAMASASEPIMPESAPVVMPTTSSVPALRAPPERLLIENQLDLPTPGDSGRTVSDTSVFNFETPLSGRSVDIPIFTDREMIEIADAETQTNIMSADSSTQSDAMSTSVATETIPLEILIGERPKPRTSTGTQTVQAHMDAPPKLLGNPPRAQAVSSRLLGPTDIDILRAEATQASERMRIAEIKRAAEVRENNRRLADMRESERLKSLEEKKAEFRDVTKAAAVSTLVRDTLVPDVDEGNEASSSRASTSAANTSAANTVEPVDETVESEIRVSLDNTSPLTVTEQSKWLAYNTRVKPGEKLLFKAELNDMDNDGVVSKILRMMLLRPDGTVFLDNVPPSTIANLVGKIPANQVLKKVGKQFSSGNNKRIEDYKEPFKP